MELADFLRQTQGEVRAEIGERLSAPGAAYPFPESVFTEVVMQHMSDVGMTFDPVACHYSAKVGSANLKLSGYAVSDDSEQLDLFVSAYDGVDELVSIPDSETKTAAEQCFRFLAKCAEGRLADTMEQANDAFDLANIIQDCFQNLDQIRIYVLTDRQARTKNFKPRDILGKTVKLEVMDIERLHRHWSEGKPRDELVVNFVEVCGDALPCVYVPGADADYDYAVTAIPGEALRFIYERYGGQLLEANVRSFLSATGKINRGIRDTLKNQPERFMAYNNGIVLTADKVALGKTADGGVGISYLEGMQIVNGGQTTASIYFTKKKNPEIDLRSVRVPAKIIVLKKSNDVAAEEALISDISKFANSQNSVKLSDLSANRPFHVQIEKLSLSVFCPDGVGRWFYERAAGSYNTMLAREGTTPHRLKQLREAIPSARRITKTDLAKYLTAWNQRPDLVSLGSQKNFEKFMDSVVADGSTEAIADTQTYKRTIAKAILFKATQKLVRPLFPAFQANIATYTVSLVAMLLGDRIDLGKIWANQDLSTQLKSQIQTWAAEVDQALRQTAGGRMVSEWAKKEECWTELRAMKYSPPSNGLPEFE